MEWSINAHKNVRYSSHLTQMVLLLFNLKDNKMYLQKHPASSHCQFIFFFNLVSIRFINTCWWDAAQLSAIMSPDTATSICVLFMDVHITH